MNCIQARFNSLLSHNTNGACPAPLLTPQLANALIERLQRMRLFAHAYPLLTNLTQGRVVPGELLDFAYRHQ